jgi:hypothetical protein
MKQNKPLYKITVEHFGTIHTFVSYWPSVGLISDTGEPLVVKECKLAITAIESGLLDCPIFRNSIYYTITVSLF